MDKQVIFQIGNQNYGIDSLRVKSIGTVDGVTMLPGAPSNVTGVLNMRGSWCAVYSIHKKFGVPAPATSNPQHIFVDSNGILLGIAVDGVREIAEIDEDYQSSVPVILQNSKTDYVSGIIRHKDKLVTLINADGILTPREAAQLENCLRLRREEEEREEKERELQRALEEARKKEKEQQEQEDGK